MPSRQINEFSQKGYRKNLVSRPCRGLDGLGGLAHGLNVVHDTAAGLAVDCGNQVVPDKNEHTYCQHSEKCIGSLGSEKAPKNELKFFYELFNLIRVILTTRSHGKLHPS